MGHITILWGSTVYPSVLKLVTERNVQFINSSPRPSIHPWHALDWNHSTDAWPDKKLTVALSSLLCWSMVIWSIIERKRRKKTEPIRQAGRRMQAPTASRQRAIPFPPARRTRFIRLRFLGNARTRTTFTTRRRRRRRTNKQPPPGWEELQSSISSLVVVIGNKKATFFVSACRYVECANVTCTRRPTIYFA